jgi:hypothetical protein
VKGKLKNAKCKMPNANRERLKLKGLKREMRDKRPKSRTESEIGRRKG